LKKSKCPNNSDKVVSFKDIRKEKDEVVNEEMKRSTSASLDKAEHKEKMQQEVDDHDRNEEKYERQNEEEEGTIVIGVPEENDILCGRGNGVQTHPGNLYFRKLIKEHREAYMKATTRKQIVVEQLISAARAKGCRFLKPYEPRGSIRWVCLSDSDTRKKVSQAIRDIKGGKDELKKEGPTHEKISQKEDERPSSNSEDKAVVKRYFYPPPPITSSNVSNRESTKNDSAKASSNNEAKKVGRKRNEPSWTVRTSNPALVNLRNQRIIHIKKQLDTTQKYLHALKKNQEIMEEQQNSLIKSLIFEVKLLASQMLESGDTQPGLSSDAEYENQTSKRIRLK